MQLITGRVGVKTHSLFFKMKIYVTPPKSFVPPEGVKDGATFSVLSEFKLENGKLCLVSIDGNELTQTEEAQPGKKSETAYAEAMQENATA